MKPKVRAEAISRAKNRYPELPSGAARQSADAESQWCNRFHKHRRLIVMLAVPAMAETFSLNQQPRTRGWLVTRPALSIISANPSAEPSISEPPGIYST